MNSKDNKVISKEKEKINLIESVVDLKGKTETKTSSKSRDVKCFICKGFEHYVSQYPNKRAMIMLENGNMESVSSSEDEMSPLKDCSNDEVEECVYGDLLVTRKVLRYAL